MDWLHTLLSWWASFSNTMAVWAYQSETWLWPLNALAPFFRALSSIADGLFSGFFDFVYWADRINRDIQEKAGQSWVYAVLSAFLAPLNMSLNWLTNQVNNIGSTINNWWSGVSTTVLGWFEAAKTYALGLVNTLQGLHNTLESKWNTFWTVTFPTLADRLTVDAMIKAAFKPWTDLFNWWGEFYKEVKVFFLNPLDWLWDKFTDWFFGE